MAETTYSGISNPYNVQLMRPADMLNLLIGGGNMDTSITQQQQAALMNLAQPGGNTAASSTVSGGPTQQVSVGSSGALADVTISSSIQSQNWAPKTVGFYINGRTGYAEFSNVFIAGSLSAAILDIPNATTANSFHVDSSGNTWWGTTTATGYATAPASILNTGAASFSSITITGGSITGTPLSAIPNNSSTDISLLGFSHNLVFSSASATQINWGSGTIVLSNGRTFTISAGNTGVMAAATYIYLDTGVSSTVLQHTTTYTTAMGANKTLIATAQNNATAASVIPFGGGQPVLDGVGNIAANSITAASIAASTITADRMSVSTLSAISANIGTVTSGSINGLTITGGTIRTASTNPRVELTSTSNDVSIYDSGGTRRMQLLGQGTTFWDAAGNNVADIYAGVTGGLLITTANSGSVSRSIFIAGGTSGVASLGIGSTNYIYANGATSEVYLAKDLQPVVSTLGIGTGTYALGTLKSTFVYMNTVGYVNANATAGTPYPAASFAITHTATGRYTITHPFGSTSYCVVIVPVAAAGKVWALETRTSTDFLVRIANFAGTLEDNDFMFIFIPAV